MVVSGRKTAVMPTREVKYMLNYGEISKFLTGRRDIIRKNRVQKQYKEAVKELQNFIEYWKQKHTK